MQRLTLDPENFKKHGFKNRIDALTQEPFKIGDSVVICDRCRAASLESSWESTERQCACREPRQAVDMTLRRRALRQPQPQPTDSPRWLATGFAVAAIIVGLALFPKYTDNVLCRIMTCETAVQDSSGKLVDNTSNPQNKAMSMTKQEQLQIAPLGLTLGSPSPTAEQVSHRFDQQPVVVNLKGSSTLGERGVKVGMVLTKVAGVDVNSLASAERLITKFKGTKQDSIELQFEGANGSCRTLVPSGQGIARPQSGASWLGVTMNEGTTGAVMVRALSRNLPIDLNGLRTRDRIISIDCAPARSVGQVNRLIGDIGSDAVLTLKIFRNGKVKFLRVATIGHLQAASLAPDKLLYQDNFEEMFWWLDELGLSAPNTDQSLALEQRLRAVFRSQSDLGFPNTISLTWGALFAEMQNEIAEKRSGSVERFASRHDVSNLRVLSILDQIAKNYWTVPSGERFVAAVGASSHFTSAQSPACRTLSAGLERGRQPIKARICKRRTPKASLGQRDLFIYSQ